MQPSQGNEKERLKLVVKSQHCDGLVREAGQNDIERHDIDCIKRLHQDRGVAQPVNGFDTGQHLSLSGRTVKPVPKGNGCRHNLSRNRGIGRSRNPQGRDGSCSEDQNRVQDNIRHRTNHLRQHGPPHVSRSLMHLGPDTLQKDTDAAHAHNSSILNSIFNGFRRRGRGHHIWPHQQSTGQGKGRPADQRQGCTSSCRFLHLLPPGVLAGHLRIHPYAGSHGNGRDDQLNRENNREGSQTVS